MPDSTAALATLRDACRELAKLSNPNEVKDLRDKAEAIRKYLRDSGAGLEAQNAAAEIRLGAERRLGELIPDNFPHGAGPNKRSQAATLKGVGLTRSDSERFQRLAEIPESRWVEFVVETKEAKRELTQAAALLLARQLSQTGRHTQFAAKAQALPGNRFPLIYADPTWEYDFAQSASRAIENQYPTMPVEEIAALPISELTADDALIFLWATQPKLIEALQVIKCWGFEYRTGMVWVKDKIGMGYYAREQHELLLIGKRGNPPPPDPETRPSSVIESPRTKHSAKPECVYAMLERMFPDWPKIELFARNKREGWDSWGNEA